MAARLLLLPALALALAPLAGCGPPPPLAQLAMVTTRSDAVAATPLADAVTGEWCFSVDLVTATLTPPWRSRRADHGRAIGLAIDSVPGANVLTDVRVQVRVEQYLLFQRICAVATGRAGHVR